VSWPDVVIRTEQPIQKIWTLFHYLMNEPQAKEILFQHYREAAALDEKTASRFAYDNTHNFIYLLKQGEAYFDAAEASKLMVKPVLVYYGVVSLMKALLVLHDPLYPRTTSVLQHGVTSRKKKKMHYSLLQDEVKVQKDGLLPHFASHVCAKTVTIGEKFRVEELFRLLPELQDCYQRATGERSLLPINLTQRAPRVWELRFDQDVVAAIRGTETLASFYTRFQPLLQEKTDPLEMVEIQPEQGWMTVAVSNTFDLLRHPRVFRDYRGQLYLLLDQPARLSDPFLVYHPLAYLFGMLCRYDTELWGELIFSFQSHDIYFIEEFIQLCLRAFPNLVLNHLYRQQFIFRD
jgi:hypothetical protein